MLNFLLKVAEILAGGFIADLAQKKQIQSCVSSRNVAPSWIMSLDLVELIGHTLNIRSAIISRPDL